MVSTARRLLLTVIMTILTGAGLFACVGDDDPQDAARQPLPTSPPREGGAEASEPSSTYEPAPLLPDLEPMPMRELYIEGEGDARVLRFSTTVLNSGEGPLELAGSYESATNEFVASQHTLMEDGEFRVEEVGRFVFHPAHAHWHFEDFTLLEVWTVDERGESEELALSTGKGTFCAVDEVPEMDHAAEPAYFTCGEGVQGISAGWSDTYGSEIPGQELALGDLPDGDYMVRAIVDPDDRLAESDDANNVHNERVEITGSEVRVEDGEG